MRIESVIQKQAYRVDEPSAERPEAVLRLIDEWEAQIPPIASEPACWNVPCCSRDWFLGRSGEARLYLLRPLTAKSGTADPSLIRLVAKYAAETCEIQYVLLPFRWVFPSSFVAFAVRSSPSPSPPARPCARPC